jgi:hypothetical protein
MRGAPCALCFPPEGLLERTWRQAVNLRGMLWPWAAFKLGRMPSAAFRVHRCPSCAEEGNARRHAAGMRGCPYQRMRSSHMRANGCLGWGRRGAREARASVHTRAKSRMPQSSMRLQPRDSIRNAYLLCPRRGIVARARSTAPPGLGQREPHPRAAALIAHGQLRRIAPQAGSPLQRQTPSVQQLATAVLTTTSQQQCITPSPAAT